MSIDYMSDINTVDDLINKISKYEESTNNGYPIDTHYLTLINNKGEKFQGIIMGHPTQKQLFYTILILLENNTILKIYGEDIVIDIGTD